LELESIGALEHWNTNWDYVMENAKKFRQHAADCLRLAERANSNDRAILLEIASAWIACAEEAERKEKSADNKGLTAFKRE
jgi:hypothetical protein